MKRYVPLLVLCCVGFLFCLVCLLVWLNAGKSSRWLGYKLKLGGIIIGLTAISSGCRVRQATCYMFLPRVENHEIVPSLSADIGNAESGVAGMGISAGIGPDKYPPERFRYECGISSTLRFHPQADSLALGPYLTVFYRIGYLTDVYVSGDYRVNLNGPFKSAGSVNAGISYPCLFHTDIGISAGGCMEYNFNEKKMVFYPSVRVYYSIPTSIPVKKRPKSD